MSNNSGGLREQLADTREELDRACDLLLTPSPEALDRSASFLKAAVTKMTACRAALGTPRQPHSVSADECRRLRLAVRRTRRLLESAAEYHQEWIWRMGAISGGYDSRGEPASLTSGGSLSLRG